MSVRPSASTTHTPHLHRSGDRRFAGDRRALATARKTVRSELHYVPGAHCCHRPADFRSGRPAPIRRRSRTRPPVGSSRQIWQDSAAREIATSLRRCAAQRLEDPLSRGWMLNQLLHRTSRAHHEFAATIGAAAPQNALSTGRAECAFKRADFRSSGVWRQIGVAAFTIGTQLKHRTLQLMVR